MTIELSFDLRLASDYHIGAGHGLEGGVDSALKRDEDGWPVIDGTTLVGLFGEAMYHLLSSKALDGRYRGCQRSARDVSEDRYCGQHGPAPEPCPVCYMLGSPAQPKRWAFSRARPSSRQAQRKTLATAGLAAQSVAHVRIDPRTRRAEEAKLFAREEGDGRLTFSFTASFVGPGAPPPAEAAMLVAAARMVRHLGAGRRRGRGQCLISLTGARGIPGWDGSAPTLEQAALDEFRRSWLSGKPEGWQSTPVLQASREWTFDRTLTEHPYRVVVVVRTEEPLLIGRRGVAGNEFQTLPVIPGSVLRGALAQRLAARYDLSDASGAAYRNFVALFCRDAVRFPTLLPALDLEGEICPAIVAPRDLACCSVYPAFGSGTGTVHRHVFLTHMEAAPDRCQDCPMGDGQGRMEPVKGFVPLSSELVGLEPRRSSEAHQRIDPRTGRVGQGDLFEYEVLAAGQYFVGEITCTKETAWDALTELCALPKLGGGPLELRLGKAQRRGHGKVLVQFGPRQNPDVHPWIGQPLKGRLYQGGQLVEPLVMTLLSDTILVDEWGRCQTGFDPRLLGGELGLEGLQLERAHCATRVVDAFNEHIGLPRGRDLALVAGSTVRLKLASAPEDLLTRLERVEREGIGLRRNEGFGVVAFNHPIYGGFRGLSTGRVGLAEGLCWPPPEEETVFGPAADALQAWARCLEREPSEDCRGERFLPLARLLHHVAGRPIAEVRRELAEVGRPRRLVGDPLPARSKPDFFPKEGKAGLDRVLALLGDCEKVLAGEVGRAAPAGPHLQRQAVEMLAEWVAGQARLPRKGGAQ